jgi:hypothetical protein
VWSEQLRLLQQRQTSQEGGMSGVKVKPLTSVWPQLGLAVWSFFRTAPGVSPSWSSRKMPCGSADKASPFDTFAIALINTCMALAVMLLCSITGIY